MENDNYLLEYENIKTGSIKDLLALLQDTQGKKLNELKVKDLTYHNDKPIWPGTGVYLFRNEREIVYVGKAQSMSFTERIAKHFDLRTYAWFNRLLELICTKGLGLEWNNENSITASKYAFEKFNVIFINFAEPELIDELETLLRSCTPALNKFKNRRKEDLSEIVDECLRK